MTFSESKISLNKLLGLQISQSRFEVVSRDSCIDYDEFYADKSVPDSETERELQVLSFNGKGVPVIKKEAAIIKARLDKGEKSQKKKEAMIGVSYTLNIVLLFSGDIKKIINEVKRLFKMRASSKIMKKLKTYFTSNENRMQYKSNLRMKLPIGSGVIESGIRRVVNLRLKSPGSFWKLDFAEKMIYLRSQILYGRWQYLKNNWTKTLAQDFRNLVACVALSKQRGKI